jgi:cytochrome c oxidase subunit 2
MVSPAAETTGFCAVPGQYLNTAANLPWIRELNMRLLTKLNGLAALALTSGTMIGSAMADTLPKIGVPVAGMMGLQPAATPVATQVHSLDHMLLIICTVIVVFVTALLAIVILRHNAKANPVPAKFTHNTPLEIAWTLVPIVILVFIGSFSLPALFNQIEIPVSDMTLKITGNQWYWTYEYPDEKAADGSALSFASNMIGNEATIDTATEPDVVPYVLNDAMVAKLQKAGYTRDDFLLAVDNPLVVPVGKVVHVIITGSDVIHAWAVPSFAVMHSAVPGRLGEMWFKVDAPGIYYGQCTALCGQHHAYMPIEVRAVTPDVYAKWLEQAKATGNVQLASN